MNIAPGAGALMLAFAATACLAEEKIALTFAWPETLKATVHVDKSKVRSTTDQAPQRMSLGTSYEMLATRGGTGTLLRFGTVTLDASQRSDIPQPVMAQLQEVLRMGMPSYKVSTEGSFAGVQDVEQYRDRIRELLMKEVPAASDPQARARMERVVDARLLNALAESEWNSIVGAWMGATLEVGQEYELMTQQPLPIGRQQMVKTRMTFAIVRRLPCERAGVTLQCVEVEMTNVPEAGEFTKAVADLARELSGGKADGPVPTMEVSTEVRLVTEPDTLVPHAYTRTKRLRVQMQEAGKDQELVDLEESRVEYTYPP